ncbi:MAG: hypothetical protein U0360_00940 [Dehalococcoidia bacterium]
MPSPIVFFQIGSLDAPATAAFLRDVFDWSVDASNEALIGIDTGASQVIPNDIVVSGAIRQLSSGRAPFTSVYVRVADLDDTLVRAAAHGARIVVPRTDRPGQPTVAIIEAPGGHSFGVVQL